MSSFPEWLAGICISRGLEKEASFAPGRQTLLNLTAPSQLRRPLTVLGGSQTERGVKLVLAVGEFTVVPVETEDVCTLGTFNLRASVGGWLIHI